MAKKRAISVIYNEIVAGAIPKLEHQNGLFKVMNAKKKIEYAIVNLWLINNMLSIDFIN